MSAGRLARGARAACRSPRFFALGAWEFRRSFTTHVDGVQADAYDWGREFAHAVTGRRWDDAL